MPQNDFSRNRILFLVPTKLEFDQFARQTSFGELDISSHICGFGPIAAAARTASLINVHRPEQVVLSGIAGTYDMSKLAVGTATAFTSVAIYGVGTGEGENFQTASAMGFQQWPGEGDAEAVGDVLKLGSTDDSNGERMLLTCCASSANPVDTKHRQRCFPSAIAEDMEGFGVALACKLAHVPLTIVRGISNQAGDCNKNNWTINEAIAAAWKLAKGFVAPDGHPETSE